MDRKRFASGSLGILSAISTTVVSMTWPQLPLNVGVPILVMCAVLAITAIALWFWPDEREQRSRLSGFFPRRSRWEGKIPFVQLRPMALAAGIDLPRYGENQNNAYHLESAMKEAAANGRLAVWGRVYNGPVKDNDPMVPVPAEHFRTYSFRHGLLTYEGPNTGAATTTMELLAKGDGHVKGETYYDLHVLKGDAKAVLKKFLKDQHNEKA